MLSVAQLAFAYPGKRVLEDITFTLPVGEITALVGPNGAGKTTLLRCLAALQLPFAGRITLAGEDVFDQPRAYHAQIGYLADDFGLYDELTVTQSLMLAARRHEVPAAQVAKRVEQTLTDLGLTPHRQKRASQLSRGLRQRLGIGQTIIHQPRFLLLDEPASGLDPEARMSLATLFGSLKKQGITLLVSSHILAELEAYSDHMLVLREGRLAGFETLRSSTVIGRPLTLTLSQPWPALAPLLTARPELAEIQFGENTVTCLLNGGPEAQTALLRELVRQGVPLLSFFEGKEDIQTRYINNYVGRDRDNA